MWLRPPRHRKRSFIGPERRAAHLLREEKRRCAHQLMLSRREHTDQALGAPGSAERVTPGRKGGHSRPFTPAATASWSEALVDRPAFGKRRNTAPFFRAKR